MHSKHKTENPKFHAEFPWEGGNKVCINGLGHMTEMIATPIYGKTLSKIKYDQGNTTVTLCRPTHDTVRKSTELLLQNQRCYEKFP